ncbi:hypothetical protein AwDysgo_21480 [Bacteroidales bacterium]|nr:hypothetical protein AwDysgo_21480 [Bacteroidales bacterium]
MKKKIFGSIAVLAFAAIVAFNVGLTKSDDNLLSDVNFENVEAQAWGESILGYLACPGVGYACAWPTYGNVQY